MPSGIQLTETSQSAAATPSSGRDTVFIDALGNLEVKNSAGNTRNADNTVYRTIYAVELTLTAAAAAGTYTGSGNNLVVTATWGTSNFVPHWLAASDYGDGWKMRVQCTVLPNNVAPGAITFTGGLYTVTANSGTAGAWIPTLGTVVTGSTAAIASPAASTPVNAVSGDFNSGAANFTDNRAYVLACVTNASTAANSNTKIALQLQVRNT